MGPDFVESEADSIQGNFLKKNIQKYLGTGSWRGPVKGREALKLKLHWLLSSAERFRPNCACFCMSTMSHVAGTGGMLGGN